MDLRSTEIVPDVALAAGAVIDLLPPSSQCWASSGRWCTLPHEGLNDWFRRKREAIEAPES